MANIASNKKSKLQSDKKYIFNKTRISALKTSIKKAKKTRNVKDLAIVCAIADSLSRKGIIHRNKANRIKIRTAKFVNKNIGGAKKESKITQNSTKDVNKKIDSIGSISTSDKGNSDNNAGKE